MFPPKRRPRALPPWLTGAAEVDAAAEEEAGVTLGVTDAASAGELEDGFCGLSATGAAIKLDGDSLEDAGALDAGAWAYACTDADCAGADDAGAAWTGADWTGAGCADAGAEVDCSFTGAELAASEVAGVELTTGAEYDAEVRLINPVPVPVDPAGTLLLPMGKGAAEGSWPWPTDEGLGRDCTGASLGAPPFPPFPPFPPLGAGTVTVTVLACVMVTVVGPPAAQDSPFCPKPEPGAPEGDEPEPGESDAGELPIPPAPDDGELPIPPAPVDSGTGTI